MNNRYLDTGIVAIFSIMVLNAATSFSQIHVSTNFDINPPPSGSIINVTTNDTQHGDDNIVRRILREGQQTSKLDIPCSLSRLLAGQVRYLPRLYPAV